LCDLHYVVDQGVGYFYNSGMNNAFDPIAAIAGLLADQLRELSLNDNLSDKAYIELREATVDAVNLQQKIKVAKGWSMINDSSG